MSISKKDLSYSLKKETKLSMENASNFVDTFFESLSESFQKNDTVKIAGLGTFKKFKTKSRIGRNPKTLESFPILPKSKIKFMASNKVKKLIN